MIPALWPLATAAQSMASPGGGFLLVGLLLSALAGAVLTLRRDRERERWEAGQDQPGYKPPRERR